MIVAAAAMSAPTNNVPVVSTVTWTKTGNNQWSGAFGNPAGASTEAQRGLFKELAGQEVKSSQDVSNIMDDMQAYFERRRFLQFKTVFEDMVRQDVIGGLRQLGDDLPKENGLSMAQCEYWCDTLDRWAEDLVEPASGGT